MLRLSDPCVLPWRACAQSQLGFGSPFGICLPFHKHRPRVFLGQTLLLTAQGLYLEAFAPERFESGSTRKFVFQGLSQHVGEGTPTNFSVESTLF